MTEIEREIVLPAGPDEVWEAVTDPGQLGDWFGADVDGDLEPGEVVRFRSPDGTERRALTETVDPPKRLAFRWLPEEGRSGSRVEIELDEVAHGTRLRIVETLIDAAVDPVPHIGFRPLARV
jgi:uncharacterized protein YndB with AHSA1/START domain